MHKNQGFGVSPLLQCALRLQTEATLKINEHLALFMLNVAIILKIHKSCSELSQYLTIQREKRLMSKIDRFL